MARVSGLGGVFFKSDDPDRLAQWYAKHLELDIDPSYRFSEFKWRERESDAEGTTVWSIFDGESSYFEGKAMINYRVADLRTLLATLADEGVEQVGEIQEESYGLFAWIRDADGNRIELWQPIEPPA